MRTIWDDKNPTIRTVGILCRPVRTDWFGQLSAAMRSITTTCYHYW